MSGKRGELSWPPCGRERNTASAVTNRLRMETTAAGEAAAGDIAAVPVRRAGLGSTVMTLGVFERATVVLVAAFAIGNAVWIARYRHGQPLDIDEAGYLLLALHDFHGYAANGVAGWLGAVELVSPHGPFTRSGARSAKDTRSSPGASTTTTTSC